MLLSRIHKQTIVTNMILNGFELCYVIVNLCKFICSLFFSEWDRDNPKVYPKILPVLIKNGVPEALRGEVWQRITGASLQQEEIIGK